MKQYYTLSEETSKKKALEIDNFIFDLDGTLIDSSEDIIFYLEKAIYSIPGFREIRVEKKHIGPPLIDVIKKIVPGIDDIIKNEILEKFKYYYDTSSFKKTKLFPDTIKLLRNLTKKNKQIFLVTNKRLVPTLRIIRLFKINYFTDIITSDILGEKKLNKVEMIQMITDKWRLLPYRTIMIGDTTEDIQAAQISGILSCAFINGYGDPEEMKKANPSFIYSNNEELINFFT
jgi:phosphoglycolate phosphatase